MKNWILGATLLAACLTMSCGRDRADGSSSPIRIGWWRSDKELYTYVFRPTKSNAYEVAVAVRGEILDGPAVEESLPTLLSLVKKAHAEVAKLNQVNAGERSQTRRLVVDYEMGGRQTFTLEGPLPDMLKIFGSASALRDLLRLASSNQPKNYRILDEPGPLKQMGKEP